MAAVKNIGGISFSITASTEKLARQLAKSRSMISSFVGEIKGAALSVTGLGGLLSAGAFVKFTRDAYEAVDVLAKTSDRLGITTEALTGLQLAAEDNKVPLAALHKGLQTLSQNAFKAATGDDKLAASFKSLGINAKELAGMSLDRQFIATADAISRLASPTEQLALASAVYGKNASAMIGLLKQGRAATEEAMQMAKEFGLVLSREQASAVEKANKGLTRLGLASRGLFRQIAIETAPLVEKLTQSLTSKGFKSIASIFRNLSEAIKPFIGELETALAKIDLILKGVSKLSDWGVFVYGATIYSRIAKSFRAPASPAKSSQSGGAAGFGGLVSLFSDAGAFDALPSRETLASLGVGANNAIVRGRQRVGALPWEMKLAFARMQQQDWFVHQPKNGILDMAGMFASNMLGPSARSWAGAAQGLGGQMWRQLGWMSQAAGNYEPQKQRKMDRPALSFAESGSVESYRQQAAIRRQSENIAKKQLNVQEQIRDGIDGLAGLLNFPVANLGKG